MENKPGVYILEGHAMTPEILAKIAATKANKAKEGKAA